MLGDGSRCIESRAISDALKPVFRRTTGIYLVCSRLFSAIKCGQGVDGQDVAASLWGALEDLAGDA